jgi:undecaprenyl-diphosphatase
MSEAWETLSYLILGLLQGLTEFLPVSSSGHLALGTSILHLPEEDLTFAVLVHGATALSTIVVFRSDISRLFLNFLKKNDEGLKARKYLALIAISAIPAAVVGLSLKDTIESLGSTQFVGGMLIVTAVILAISQKVKAKFEKPLKSGNVILIGLAQAMAILPGISRSGSTIGAALLLGISRAEAAKFSFLMALPPIIGANLLEMKGLAEANEPFVNNSHIPVFGYTVGVVAAFLAGIAACKWMVALVKGANLMWFAVYCLIVGMFALCL